MSQTLCSTALASTATRCTIATRKTNTQHKNKTNKKTRPNSHPVLLSLSLFILFLSFSSNASILCVSLLFFLLLFPLPSPALLVCSLARSLSSSPLPFLSSPHLNSFPLSLFSLVLLSGAPPLVEPGRLFASSSLDSARLPQFPHFIFSPLELLLLRQICCPSAASAGRCRAVLQLALSSPAPTVPEHIVVYCLRSPNTKTQRSTRHSNSFSTRLEVKSPALPSPKSVACSRSCSALRSCSARALKLEQAATAVASLRASRAAARASGNEYVALESKKKLYELELKRRRLQARTSYKGRGG